MTGLPRPVLVGLFRRRYPGFFDRQLAIATVEPGLARNISAAAREAWHIMGCTGYARVDVRVDTECVPHVLEVNCNPDLSPAASFHRSAQAGGHCYESMVTRILEMALACA